MNGYLFAVAENGQPPTFVFADLDAADRALRCEFWECPDGVFRSADDRWVGEFLTVAEANRVLFGVRDAA